MKESWGEPLTTNWSGYADECEVNTLKLPSADAVAMTCTTLWKATEETAYSCALRFPGCIWNLIFFFSKSQSGPNGEGYVALSLGRWSFCSMVFVPSYLVVFVCVAVRDFYVYKAVWPPTGASAASASYDWSVFYNFLHSFMALSFAMSDSYFALSSLSYRAFSSMIRG